MEERIKGRIESIVYHNKENDYTVLEISDAKENLITAVGTISMPGEGEEVELVGAYTYHKEFGKQFAFTSYEKSLPREIEGIIQYLSSGVIKGVGPITALKIVNRFGLDTFDVIETHPEWLTDIPGITRKKAAAITESFMEQRELYGVMVFFKDYLDASSINKVYRRFGTGAVGIIRDNPYILCGEDFSQSFATVDRIAASFGYGRDREERIRAGIRYILDYNARANGHTCLPKAKLIAAVAHTLEQDESLIANYLEASIEDGTFAEYRMNDAIYVMTSECDDIERTIAARLFNISRSVEKIGRENIASLINTAEAYSAISYAALQREAMYRSLAGGVTIITGGPGTGKTTIIKGLISIFNNLGMDTVLCAPTGRAAKRMGEATSEEAKTIHRLLEMEKTEAGDFKFNRNQRNPLDEKVVIVDEVSMVDLSLLSSLLLAMRRGSRLILIGDADQLPSVGAGCVLDDLIESGVIPVVRLTEIFRQSGESLIVENAHKINNGEMPVLNATDKDFFFLRRDNEATIADTISTLITERLPRTYGTSIRDDIQVVCPSKRGSGGIELLNQALQDKINPPAKFKKEKLAHSVIFREGDRVMQISNDYEIEWERGNETGLGVFNGDIGIIETIIEKDECMVIRFDDKVVHYSFDKLDELELAYAITVHKSQGSEYPVVIMPIYKCAPMLMSRNLLYTAITRARRMVILVGRQDIVKVMVDNDKEIDRYTTLAHRLSSSIDRL